MYCAGMFVLNKSSFQVLVIEEKAEAYIEIKEKLEEVLIYVQVLWFDNIADAIKGFSSKKSNDYDLIFLNYKMSKTTSGDVVEKFLKSAKGTPLILLPSAKSANKVKYYGSLSMLFAEDGTSQDKESPRDGKPLVMDGLEFFDLAPVPSVIFDDESFKIMKMNAAAGELLGVFEDEILGKSVRKLVSKVDKFFFDKYLKAHVSNNEQVFYVEKSNGEKIMAEFKVSYLQSAAGKMGLLYFTDVTDKLAQNARLELQNKRFRELAFIQSHLVRAPLARLMGLVSVINEYQDLDGNELSFYLESIVDSANELDGLVKELANNEEFENPKFSLMASKYYG